MIGMLTFFLIGLLEFALFAYENRRARDLARENTWLRHSLSGGQVAEQREAHVACARALRERAFVAPQKGEMGSVESLLGTSEKLVS